MHDYFDILGVSPDACAREIQRACRRRASATHPDFRDDAPGGRPGDAAPVELVDVAVDFVEMAPIVDRMQASFFGSGT
jgi:DnaJ domain